MLRNGSLTLVAAIMALALVIRLENTAQAQVIDPPPAPTGGLIYTPSNIRLGNVATLVAGSDGITRIDTVAPGGNTAAIGQQTSNIASGTVLENSGTSSLNTGPGAVIRTTSREPAIKNGSDNRSMSILDRYYKVRIINTGTGYFIEYGYYRQGDDPDTTFIPITNLYDGNGNPVDLPKEILDGITLANGSTLTLSYNAQRGTYGFAIPSAYNIEGLPPLAYGDPPYVWPAWTPISVTDPRVPGTENSVDIPGLSDDDLDPTVGQTGSLERGNLTINNPRNNPARLMGNDRTLIQGATTAIENHGNITVYDAQIQAGNTGILHAYSGSSSGYYYGSGYYGDSYNLVTNEDVRLYNTQIGSPGGGRLYYDVDPDTGTMYFRGDWLYSNGYLTTPDTQWYSYDPGTGIFTVVPGYTPSLTAGGIAVNGNGTPDQTISYLGPNRPISTIVNGRIAVGQNVTVKRNPIAGIDYIDGPAIGIHTQTHGMFDGMLGYGRDYAYIANDDWGYSNPRYAIRPMPGEIDRGSFQYGGIGNTIEVRDNSWIFAQTGISFGNPTEFSPIHVFIDRTSGIYATSTGITDRESLMGLWVWNGNVDDPDEEHLGDFSGQSHEIRVEGKVIVGSPSQSGISLTFLSNTSNLNSSDLERLSKVYYYDPSDPDADSYGNVYFSGRTASKFQADNTDSSRQFWLRMPGGGSVPLTQYDRATQRWIVHPDAPDVLIRSGSEVRSNYFTAFDYSSGIGIEVLGGSMAWEGSILLPNGSGDFYEPWSIYYGPTVREISVLGDDALVTGGNYLSGGAAMYFGSYAHVAKVVIGDNKDLKNLSNVLYIGGTDSKGTTTLYDLRQTARNFRAFDTMTSIDRAKLLYDPAVLFSDDPNVFNFDNAGVQGDIVSNFSAVAYLFGGSGTGSNGTGWEVTYNGQMDAFWIHGHPGASPYNDEILGIGYTSGFPGDDGSPDPSYLMGHRDYNPTGYPQSTWTADSIPGQSMILDEILLWYLAGRQNSNSGNYESLILPSFSSSYGYAPANNQKHYREALARFLHFGAAEAFSGLSVAELLEGYTRDGTLVIFTGGDIFSGNIFGGGLGDSGTGYGEGLVGSYTYSIGNIDIRVKDGTTLFNRNVIEQVVETDILRLPGIRVRDVYVEKTGHLMLNDAQFAVNPFSPYSSSPDYADRLITHDVLNEGLVSGNGVFQIAQRWDYTSGTNYFAGYFINRGVLAPGLPGFIGETEVQARALEAKAYQNMLGDSAKFVDWDTTGVPGGQFGAITIFGSLLLMDEQYRPVYDPTKPLFNSVELLEAGQYHVTIGNDTIGGIFGKYAATIAQATSVYRHDDRYDRSDAWIYDDSLLNVGEVSKEDWKIIATEKLGTHLSWFSPAAMVDSDTGLPLLTTYEQFEYLTDARRRAALQRKMVEAVLTPSELRRYDADPVQRAQLNKKMLEQNNIRFDLTPLDSLLVRYGFSDVVSVYGTVSPYTYAMYGWDVPLTDYGSPWSPPSRNVSGRLNVGVTQLGGVVQADRIFDMDTNAAGKEKQTSFIIIASEGYAFNSSVKMVTSSTTDWVYANVDVLPVRMASGQSPTVLTVIDDPHYYLNRVSSVKAKYNARSVARALDDAMMTNPGLAQSFEFGLNSPEVLNNVFRQVASSTRANSVMMNVGSPSDGLFNQIGYGHGGLSTGNRGNVVFRNKQTGQLQQPYGQPAVPPPGTQFAPPGYRGQSPFYRTGSIWGTYNHSSFSVAGDGNAFKYNFDRNGAMIGNEWNLSPSAVIGGVATISEGSLRSLSDKVKSYDYDFGVYFVAAPFEQFEVKTYNGFGFQSYKSDRFIRNKDIFVGYSSNSMTYGLNDIFGISDHYDSETSGTSFDSAIEFARPFTMSPNFVIRPAMGFEYQSIRQKGYTERLHLNLRSSWSNNGTNIAEDALALGVAEGPTSGTYAMKYKSMLFNRSLMRLGFNTESYFARGGWQFRAYHVARTAGNRYPISEQSFTSGSKLFKVHGTDIGNSYAQVGFGSHLWLNQERTATLFSNVDWNFPLINKGGTMFNVNIGIQQSF